MGNPGDKQTFAKYKLHLQHGAEGLSERAAALVSSNRKRIRIEKMYKEPQSRVKDSTNGLSQTSDSQPSTFGHPTDNESVQLEEDHLTWREAEHRQENELPDRVPGIHRSIHLLNDGDLLSDRNDYDNYSNDHIEEENVEIEEDENGKNLLQEILDEIEYNVECTEAENEIADKYENFLDDPKFYESIKKCVDRSPAEVLLMVLTFALHAKLPITTISMLSRMINALVLDEVLPASKYMLDKTFNKIEHCEFHAVCPDCDIYVGMLKNEKDTVTCEICKEKMDLSNPSCLNFFMIIDPIQYIADYLQQNESYYDDVLNGKYSNNESIKDIYDGQLYKEFLQNLSANDRQNYVTAIFNTDGAPRFESSPFSIWPIYLQINELPPQERLRCAIPTALYFGEKKPNMDIFLDPFVELMKRKATDGFEVTIKGQVRRVKLYPLIGCADAPARSAMQGMVQFNGYYGCAWCEQKGKHEGSMRYPILNVPTPKLRDAKSTEDYAESAMNTGIPERGVKYASPLMKMWFFNIIRGFSPDYMHFFLGVVKQFTEYYVGNLSKENMKFLDGIMKGLAVPNQICRLSRPLSQRSHWKAKEWENWLLYYSMPILQLILTERALKHWALLVESLHILLSMDISLEMLNRAENNLLNFVKEAETIYSSLVLTSNVHQLLHVCQSVLDWGPVWAHSNFVFESANYILLRAIHCAKGVNLQIMRYINLEHHLRILKRRVYPYTDSVIKSYCEDVTYPRVQKTFKKLNIRYFGQGKGMEREYTEKLNLSHLTSQAFSKIVKDGTMYSQKENKRSCNSYVRLIDGQFVKCLNFVVDSENDKEITCCHYISTSKYAYSDHILEVTSVSDEIRTVNTTDIEKVCVFLKVGNKQYLCPVVNALYY